MMYDINYNKNNSHSKLIEGQNYWFATVQLTRKYTNISCAYTPFQITLTSKKNRGWGGDLKDHCYLNWDVSKNKQYAKRCNAESDVEHYGIVCDTEEECIAEYNKAIDQAWKDIKNSVDLSRSSLKELKESILSRKITKATKPIVV